VTQRNDNDHAVAIYVALVVLIATSLILAIWLS
jgi:hypothetical protein